MNFQELLDRFLTDTSVDVDADLYYSDVSVTEEDLAQLRAMFETKLAVSYGSNRSGLDFPPHVEPTMANANALLGNIKLEV